MADSFVPYQNPTTTDAKLDTEQLIVGANTVLRERMQVAGASALQVAAVQNSAPSTEYGLVTRNIPSGTQPASLASGTVVDLGAQADSAAAADTSTASLISLFKRQLQRMTSLIGLLPTALTGSGNLKIAQVEKTTVSTKTRTSLHSATTLTAGAGNTNSSWTDLSAGYGASIGFQLTNGATGPTVAAQVQIQVANNYNGGSPTLPVNLNGPFVGSTSNSAVTSWGVTIDPKWSAVRLVSGSNTGQNVTLDADITVTTTV